MTQSADASASSKQGAMSWQALRLLALEAAGATARDRRALIAAASPVVSVLFRRFLTHDIQAPDWPDRDRFIISPSMQPLACALLHLLGREQEAEAAGNGEDSSHQADASVSPESSAEKSAGVACDLAPRGLDLPLNLPGHGLAAALGMALATRLLRERFGEEIFNHATCVLVDDRDVEPGIAQEAIAIAPWLRPHRLLVLHLTAVRPDGAASERLRCPNHLSRFAAAGWHVQQVRADDEAALAEALLQAADQGVASWEERRPAYIAVEYDSTAEVPSTTFLRQELGWEEVAGGDVPGAVRDEWRLVGLRGRKARRAWQRRVEELPADERSALQRRLEQPLPEEFRQHMRSLRMALAEQASERDLQAMLTALLARSARLCADMTLLSALHEDLPDGGALPGADDEGGEKEAQGARRAPLMDVGLRPMALAAVLAGLAAHGGVRAVGVARRHQLPTMLPLLGEAARAGLACTLFVLEDDDRRHAPQEMLSASLRCMCPADAVELVECWQLCVQQPAGVSLIFVPGGKLPAVRGSPEKSNLCALGGYELFSGEGEARVTLFAAGRALGAALLAARRLEGENIAARVISVPVPRRLLAQPQEHRERILSAAGQVRLFVPPGEVTHAWSLLGCEDGVISPCADGALLDVPALEERIVQAVRARLAAGQNADSEGKARAADEENGS